MDDEAKRAATLAYVTGRTDATTDFMTWLEQMVASNPTATAQDLLNAAKLWQSVVDSVASSYSD